MLKGVIFDMDGVIVDSEPIHRKVANDLFKDLRISVPDKLLDSFVGVSPNQMWTKLKNKYKLQQSIKELTRMQRDKYNNYFSYLLLQERIKAMPGVIRLIEDLSENNVKLSIASSSSIKIINLVLDALKMRKFFPVIISGDEVNSGKPAPDIFIYASKCMGICLKDCIVIEDSKNGIEAAKSAKIKCIGFKNPDSGNQDLSCADLVIDNFLEIDHRKLCQFYNNIFLS